MSIQNQSLPSGNDLPWHALDVSVVVEQLKTDISVGLSSNEALSRLASVGKNQLPVGQKASFFLRLRKQLVQPLILVLLAAAIVTGALGAWADSSVIFGVVILNSLLGLFQEQKAASALAVLSRVLVTEVTVLREGRPNRLSAEVLVPGDIVLLNSGDKTPADLRLVSITELQISEAALTGESLPVFKNLDVLKTEVLLPERTNMAYAGTLVTKGQATGIVVATGPLTQTGQISDLLTGVTKLSTPLTLKLERFSRGLLIVILIIALLSFFIGVLRGESWVDMFMASVALAVGAIPEGLPAVISITLAIGVSRMAKQRAIIRNLAAVETLGSVTVICSDKTGTLTENRMTIQQLWVNGLNYEVSGSGYSKSGQILHAGDVATIQQNLRELIVAGVLCNDAALEHADDAWSVVGDPTEAALLVLAHKAKIDVDTLRQTFPRKAALPFDAERKAMATLHDVEGAHVVYVKGAWEVLIKRCAMQLDERGEAIALDEQATKVAQLMAKKGLRVLALARSEVIDNQSLHDRHISGSLVLLGLVGMIDPPRKHVGASIQACRDAGIVVKMITGDHPATARAIALQLGLADDDAQVVSGHDLANMSEDQVKAVVVASHIFARITPSQKLDIVRALQSHGEIVAMTGDGVNDAPALRQAEIGVAMGLSGTEVAKEASDMVLTDDNFATIETAIRQGRNIFDNLVKFIAWTIPTNAGEGLVILTAVLFGSLLPITPLQILWINMTTAILLGSTLAFEPGEHSVMHRPPRNPKASILNRFLLQQTLLVSILMLIAAFGLFEWAWQSGRSLEEARTLAANAFVMIEIGYLFSARSLNHTLRIKHLFANRWLWTGCCLMVAMQLGFTYCSVLNHTFSTAPLRMLDWVAIVGAALISLLIVELMKWRHFRSNVFMQ